jgi:hypothetical protein
MMELMISQWPLRDLLKAGIGYDNGNGVDLECLKKSGV